MGFHSGDVLPKQVCTVNQGEAQLDSQGPQKHDHQVYEEETRRSHKARVYNAPEDREGGLRNNLGRSHARQPAVGVARRDDHCANSKTGMAGARPHSRDDRRQNARLTKIHKGMPSGLENKLVNLVFKQRNSHFPEARNVFPRKTEPLRLLEPPLAVASGLDAARDHAHDVLHGAVPLDLHLVWHLLHQSAVPDVQVDRNEAEVHGLLVRLRPLLNHELVEDETAVVRPHCRL